MNNKIILLILFVSSIYSCKSKQTHVNLNDYKSIEYENGNKSKNLYIVDTFYIEKPVIVETIDGYGFIMPKVVYDNYQENNNSYFFNNENVYLYKYELPFFIPSDLFLKNTKSTPCLTQTEGIPKKKNILSSRQYIDESIKFQLVLIRGDYYNEVYTEIGGSPILNLSNNKFSYYRVAIPICSY